MPRRREIRRVRVERSDYLRPFAEAAHLVAANLFGPNYTEFLKEKPISEVLWHLILHMYDKNYREKTNLKIPIDVEMVNILKGNRKLGFFTPETTYDIYTRNKETGRFITPHSRTIQLTSLLYEDQLYPLQQFFRLLWEYHKSKSNVDKKLLSKLSALENYTHNIDALLPHPDDYPTLGDLPRPLLDELIEKFPNLHPLELFTLENYEKFTKPLVEKIFANGKTRAGHTALAIILGAMIGLDDPDLQNISRYSNHLDHLYRANLLDQAKSIAKSIKSPKDIFRFLASEEAKPLIQALSHHTTAPYQTLATALALLSSLHKDLHLISRYSNYLDQLIETLSLHIPHSKTPEEFFEELKRKYGGEERLTFEIDLDKDDVKEIESTSEPIWWIGSFLRDKGGYSSSDKEMKIYYGASNFIRQICGSDPECQRRVILTILDRARWVQKRKGV